MKSGPLHFLDLKPLVSPLQKLDLGNKTAALLLSETARSFDRAGQRGAEDRRETSLLTGVPSSC